MEYILGKREQIAFGEETTYGTAVSPTVVLGREATFTPKDDQNWIEIRGSGTDSVTIDTFEIGQKTAGGTLSFAPQDWRFLKFVVCDGSSDITDTDNTTYYTHTFSNSVDIASFTLERAMRLTDSSDHVLTYNGCQVDSANISFEKDSIVKVDLEVLAKDVSSGTTTTSLSVPTTLAFQYRNFKLTLNNSEVVEVTGGNIKIENNLNDARYANYTLNRTKGESAPTIRRFSGTFRVNVKDKTYYDLWNTASEIANCSFVMQRGTNDKITFTPTGFRMKNAIDPTNLDGINEVSIDWIAEDLSIVVEDSIASY